MTLNFNLKNNSCLCMVKDDYAGYKGVCNLKSSNFDRAKVEVVGSPVITDDGVVSGFSVSNYVKKDNLNITNADTITLYVPFRFTGLSSDLENFVTLYAVNPEIRGRIRKESNNDIAINIADSISKIVLIPASSLSVNSDYLLKFVFNNADFKYSVAYKKDDDVWVTVKNNANYDQQNPVTIGSLWFGSYTSGPATNCVMDLKTILLEADGQEVFNTLTTGIDTVKPDDYEDVGSPVISDDGVMIGTTGAYIKANVPEIVGKSNFAINVKGVLTENAINGYGYLLTDKTGVAVGLSLLTQNQKLAARVGSNFAYLTPNFTDNNYYNKNWNLVITRTGDTAVSQFYVEGQLIKTENIDVSSATAYTGEFYIGSWTQSDSYFKGKIDLNAFKIYVDGNLIYQPCLKIPYTLAKSDEKIVNVKYRDRVEDIYNQFGVVSYYTIDEDLENYSFPDYVLFKLNKVGDVVLNFGLTIDKEKIMTNIGTFKINNTTWVSLEDIIKEKIENFAFEHGKTYLIQNYDSCSVCVAETVPNEKEKGFSLSNKELFSYTAIEDSNIYLKTNSKDCLLNISK